ncbi:hypothetical protein QYM36_019255 [Artemia franciscana]|uniref:CCHC-type domain-containing protein n=1 Tax=Artemia franciscana TaxID=6661 RepID=A0AA88H5I3_ARTSF|nr:hypothetical protein QYM36_019255 [Artemia franciscana]
MHLYKILKCNFIANITRDGVLDVLLLDGKDTKKALEISCINNIYVKASLKSALQTGQQQKIVIYNVPPEISLADLKEGLMNTKGEEISVLEAFRLGRPNEAELVSSKSVLFILPLSTMVEKIFLFGQPKPFRLYIEKPIQCTKCMKLGHVSKNCKSTKTQCNICLEEHSHQSCNSRPKCANCKGDHNSFDKRACPKYLERHQVLKIARKENLPVGIVAKSYSSILKGNTPTLKESTKTLPWKWAPSIISTPQQRSSTSSIASPLTSPKSLLADLNFTPSGRSNKSKNNDSKPQKSNNAPMPSVQPNSAISAKDHVALSKLIQYLISVTFISQIDIPKHLKATILREIALHYFSKSIVEETDSEVISILNQCQALHYLTEIHG